MPEFYTIKEVMQALALGRTSINKLINDGQVSSGKRGLWPVIKIGKSVRISKEAVKRLVKNSELEVV